MFSLMLATHMLLAPIPATPAASPPPPAATSAKKSWFAVNFGFTVLPARLEQAAMDFRLDGAGPNAGPLRVAYGTESGLVEPGIFLGVQANPHAGILIALRAAPMFGSFASNEGKNGRVYGVAFHLGAGYGFTFGALTIAPRIDLGHVIGGYGITSFGRDGQPFVTVDGTRFFDDDIGVHVVDGVWQLGPVLQARYALNKEWSLQLDAGFLWTIARESYVNVAGFIEEDGPVEWKRKEFSDANMELKVNGQAVREANGRGLPHAYQGPSFSLGAAYHF